MIMAVADYGEYGHQFEEAQNPDGTVGIQKVQFTPDGNPVAMPSILERALISRRLGWKYLPEDLLDCDVELGQALHALAIYETMLTAGTDLTKLNEQESRIFNSILDMRDRNK